MRENGSNNKLHGIAISNSDEMADVLAICLAGEMSVLMHFIAMCADSESCKHLEEQHAVRLNAKQTKLET